MNDELGWADHQLDRLADGELSRDEYRELLAQLDREPDGWRRCAMAFLEAQAWKREFHELRAEQAAPAQLVTSASTGDRPSHWLPAPWWTLVAGILVAFALGNWWHGQEWRPHSNDEPEAVQQERRPTDAATLASSLLSPTPPLGTLSPEQLTFLVDRGDGRREQFDMPVFQASHASARRLMEQPSSLPPHVEQAIRRSGHEIRTKREWTPVNLFDGRQAMFPVEQLEIVPVSGEAYQ